MRARLEALIDEMLDGHILLAEAVNEFERLYIKKALGIHRNTISKRVADQPKTRRPLARAARGASR